MASAWSLLSSAKEMTAVSDKSTMQFSSESIVQIKQERGVEVQISPPVSF